VYFNGVSESDGKQNLTVMVYGYQISMGSSQPFSLIVSGNIASGTCQESTGPGTADPFITSNGVLEFSVSSCSSDSGGWSSGKIAGAVIGILVGCGAIGGVGYYLYRRKQMRTPLTSDFVKT